jgi:hypothetical protein
MNRAVGLVPNCAKEEYAIRREVAWAYASLYGKCC